MHGVGDLGQHLLADDVPGFLPGMQFRVGRTRLFGREDLHDGAGQGQRLANRLRSLGEKLTGFRPERTRGQPSGVPYARGARGQLAGRAGHGTCDLELRRRTSGR